MTSTSTDSDPLMPGKEIRNCLSNPPIHRNTFDRWVSTGVFPPPDRIINGRNYWHRSTAKTWLVHNNHAGSGDVV